MNERSNESRFKLSMDISNKPKMKDIEELDLSKLKILRDSRKINPYV
jgi:hypothetical protein